MASGKDDTESIVPISQAGTIIDSSSSPNTEGNLSPAVEFYFLCRPCLRIVRQHRQTGFLFQCDQHFLHIN